MTEDLTLTLTVHVTDEDIEKGIPCKYWACPITLAAARAAQEAGYYVVTAETRRKHCIIMVHNRSLPGDYDHSLKAKLPDEAWDFVKTFDAASWDPNQKRPGPLEFKLQFREINPCPNMPD